jgi:hypothetical protein
MVRSILVVACALTLVAAGCTSEQSPAQREKVRSLLTRLLEIELTLKQRFEVLRAEHPDVEPPYADSELASTDGLQRARSRLKQYSAMVEELSAMSRYRLSERENAVRSADVDESLKSSLVKSFASAKPMMQLSLDDWMEACHAKTAAIAEMLDFAERNVGQIRFENEQLAFANESLGNEYQGLQQKMAAAEDRFDRAQRAALSADDGIVPLLHDALQD